jgi:hypothetical protein
MKNKFTFYFEKYSFPSNSIWYREEKDLMYKNMKKLNGYFIVRHKTFNGGQCAWLGVDPDLVNPLKEKLSSLYKSIKFKNGARMDCTKSKEILFDRFCFKFRDEADEAAFMLYYDIGVDIEFSK